MRSFDVDDELYTQLMCRDISNFHRKFKLPCPAGPCELDSELKAFRADFMQEELNEYTDACDAGDLEGQFDALIDLVYVALGTAYLQGLPFAEGWRRVHEANMKKVRATEAGQSKRNSTSDVVKPEGWQAPCLKDLVC
jgi:predicted HAD superfamily Cof-like phosphohydrolase